MKRKKIRARNGRAVLRGTRAVPPKGRGWSAIAGVGSVVDVGARRPIERKRSKLNRKGYVVVVHESKADGAGSETKMVVAPRRSGRSANTALAAARDHAKRVLAKAVRTVGSDLSRKE